MRQPPDFVDSNYPHDVLRLHKAIYGLKQSPRAWFTKLSGCLMQWEFLDSESDYSIFIYKDSSYIVIFLIYVDDILVIGNVEHLR